MCIVNMSSRLGDIFSARPLQIKQEAEPSPPPSRPPSPIFMQAQPQPEHVPRAQPLEFNSQVRTIILCLS